MGGLVGYSDPQQQAQLIWFCEMISYSVLAFTIWYKAPQVYAVIRSGSSLGISMASLLLEFTSYSIEMTYQVAMAYPLITYVDIVFMWFQDVVLVYTVLQNRHLIDKTMIPKLALYCVWFFFMITRRLPDIVMSILIGSTTIILTTSKSLQLWKVVDTENPGSLSALTWILLSYMAFARMVTTTVMTGDLLMLSNTTSAFFLDVAVAAAIVYYNRIKARRTRLRRQRAARLSWRRRRREGQRQSRSSSPTRRSS